MKSTSLYVYVESILLLGVALIMFVMEDDFGTQQSLIQTINTNGRRPVVWSYHAGEYKGLTSRSLLHAFERQGYTIVEGSECDSTWDVLCTGFFTYGSEKLKETLRKNSGRSFKVNHVVHIGHLTSKGHFLTQTNMSARAYVPKAFEIPGQEVHLIKEVFKHPDKLWVVKNRSHRGTKIVRSEDIDFDNTTQRIYQEFVSNQFLIDNKAFTIGVYLVVTSGDPLRVYINDDMFFKYCKEDYYPFDISDQDKHITSEDAYYFWQLDSMTRFTSKGNTGLYSQRRMLEIIIEERTGKPGTVFMDQIYDCIAREFYSFYEYLNSAKQWPTLNRAAFDLLRVDFIVDEDANLILLENNMSPSMHLRAETENPVSITRHQMLHSLVKILGVPQNFVTNETSLSHERSVRIRSSDVYVPLGICYSDTCKDCSLGCELCLQCLKEENADMFKTFILEFLDKLSFRRILPLPVSKNRRSLLENINVNFSEKDVLLQKWLMQKCRRDSFWCD